MSIRMSYKLIDVVTGQSMLNENLSVVSLSNEEIQKLLEEDEDTNLLLALLAKLSDSINGKLN